MKEGMQMALYRCAACGGSKLTIETQKMGFWGLFRQGSKGKQVFKCPDCGVTLDAPMDEEIKQLIDAGVCSLSDRKNLILRGEKIDWEVLVKKYKHIESGAADRELEAELREEKRCEAEKAQRELEEAQRKYEEARCKLLEGVSCDDVADAQEGPGDSADLDDIRSEVIRVMAADKEAAGIGLLRAEQIAGKSDLLSSLSPETLQEVLDDMVSDGILMLTRDRYHAYYSYFE